MLVAVCSMPYETVSDGITCLLCAVCCMPYEIVSDGIRCLLCAACRMKLLAME